MRPTRAAQTPKGDAKAALAAIRDVAWVNSPKHQERNFKAERRGARPSLLVFEKRFIRDMHRLGIPVYCHSMVRTAAEQAELKRRGVTKAGPGESAHEYGLAGDWVHGVFHWEMTVDQWAIFGHVGKEAARALGLEMTWGGDWRFYDPAHWEFTHWKQMKEGFPHDPET